MPVTTTMTSVTTLWATYESTSVGSTSIYPSDMPLPLCTLTSGSSTSGLTTLSGTVGTGLSLPGTAASPSKTSGAMRTGTKDLNERCILVGIGALIAWISG